MAAKQTPEQKKTIDRVMHEFKHGELKIRGNGPKVTNPKQAIAIALHEAGASNQESPAENKRELRRTKAKEAKGETAMQEKEGRGAKTRTELYEAPPQEGRARAFEDVEGGAGEGVGVNGARASSSAQPAAGRRLSPSWDRFRQRPLARAVRARRPRSRRACLTAGQRRSVCRPTEADP